MRWAALVLAAGSVCAGALALPPYANELMLPSGGIAAIPNEAPAIPKVARGQFIGVACAKIEQVASEGIRVVMYLAPDEPSPGYIGVLAIDQKVTPGTIHVRVPDTPELADHTVRVRVYFVDQGGRHMCDAGKVRIV